MMTSDQLSLVRQCDLLKLSRSSVYYTRKGESTLNLKLMRMIDEKYWECPFYGSRQMMRWLHLQGDAVGRKRVRRLMRLLGIEAIYQKPRTKQLWFL